MRVHLAACSRRPSCPLRPEPVRTLLARILPPPPPRLHHLFWSDLTQAGTLETLREKNVAPNMFELVGPLLIHPPAASPLGHFVCSSFSHLPGAGMSFTAVPQIETAFLGIKKHQAGTRAQTGTLTVHLYQIGFYLRFATDTKQPPAIWRGEGTRSEVSKQQ